MSDGFVYVPVLRWKQSEWMALRYLDDQVADAILPLIEIPPSRYEDRETRQVTDIDAKTEDVAEKLYINWGTRPFFLDLNLINTTVHRTSSGRHILEMMCTLADASGLCMTPVIGLHRNDDYQRAVLEACNMGNGLCLKVAARNALHLAFPDEALMLIESMGLGIEDTDLIVDFGIVEGMSIEYRDVLGNVPQSHAWRNLIFTGGSFPRNLTEMEPGTNRLPRNEWQSWRAAVGGIGSEPIRIPIFSDSTIQHPLFEEPPVRSNPSASVRYAVDSDWLVFRGRGLRTRGRGGSQQYIGHAILLSDHPEFYGQEFSYGDRYISEIAAEQHRPGSPMTWLRAGINHHITLAVQQLSNPPFS